MGGVRERLEHGGLSECLPCWGLNFPLENLRSASWKKEEAGQGPAALLGGEGPREPLSVRLKSTTTPVLHMKKQSPRN